MTEDASEVRRYEETPRLAEFLGELSFSGFKELGFDQLLLVEGASDIKTVQQFLRPLRKDHKIVVLSLGGAQMINADRESELSEVLRITEHVSVLIDSERTSEKDPLDYPRQAFVETCNKLGINNLVLSRRAIENYLTENAIRQELGQKYRALGPYERLQDVQPSWRKHENWRIARRMSIEDIKDIDLGRFFLAL